MRVKRGTVGARKRKKILQQASGYWGAKSTQYRAAKTQVMKSGNYAYRDRRNRRRERRRLWIIRINAAVRLHGWTYSQFVAGLNAAGIALDRKALAFLAICDPPAFGAVVQQARAALQVAAQPA